MKIVYVGNFRLPNYDAAAARVLSIAHSLKASGNEVTILSWGGKYAESHIGVDGVYRIDGMKYIITDELDAVGLINKIKIRLNKGKKSLAIIKQICPDVVISYNSPFSFNQSIIRLSQKLGFKLVADITEWYDNNDLYFFDRYSNWKNMTRVYRKFKNKIPISYYLSNYYNDSNNLVIPALCNSSDEKWNITVGGNDAFDGLTLIYAGNPARKDNVHTAINAVNRLSTEGLKIRFIIVGITREAYITKYRSLLDTIELSDNILFVGRVSQDKVPALYTTADFMILLRDNTRKSNAGFPTKFAESMMSGTPVICNSTSDLSHYVKDGENGFLLSSPDYTTVYNCLKKIASNWSPELSSRMKDKAKQTGLEYFDCKKYVNLLNEFINTLR